MQGELAQAGGDPPFLWQAGERPRPCRGRPRGDQTPRRVLEGVARRASRVRVARGGERRAVVGRCGVWAVEIGGANAI